MNLLASVLNNHRMLLIIKCWTSLFNPFLFAFLLLLLLLYMGLMLFPALDVIVVVVIAFLRLSWA